MKSKIVIQCKVEINNEYWFAAGNSNGLFKKNLLTGKLDFIGYFPGEGKSLLRAYSDAVLIGDNIIYAPCYAETIAVYNIKEKKFSNINFPIGEETANKYLNCVNYNGRVYFIPFLAEAFLKYDLYQGRLDSLDDWLVLKNENISPEVKNFVIEYIYSNDNYIFMFLNGVNKVIILDMDTDIFQIKNIDISSNDRICFVCGINKDVWIVTNRGDLYRWNYINEKVQYIHGLNLYGDIYDDYKINYGCVTDRYIYFASVYYSEILIFDFINNQFEIIDMSKYVYKKKDKNLFIYCYYDLQRIGSNKVQIYSFYDGKYITLEGNMVSDSYSGFVFPEKYLEDCYGGRGIQEYNLMHLGLSCSVVDILIHSEDINSKKGQIEDVGKIIHNTIMQRENVSIK